MLPVNPAPASTFDCVVVGATPAGIAAAVRAAREGLTVLLTQHDGHIGGMCTNGLGQWDAMSGHRRCPILREIVERNAAFYRGTPDEANVTWTWSNYPVAAFAPGRIEQVFEAMVAGEPRITLWRHRIPATVRTVGRCIQAITVSDKAGQARQEVTATTCIDATYEGDLLALAGATYHVGREGFADYGEPHAGVIYTGAHEPKPHVAGAAGAQVRPFDHAMSLVHPDSPRTGDGAIQAYNLRGCLTERPELRILVETPPASYDRSDYLGYVRRWVIINNRCEGKASYNAAILPGENHAYPEGDWATRERITCRHMDFGLGLLHFLQFDPSVDEVHRRMARQWSLCADEWTDNGHLPYEMYVRETRRLRGRTVLTELDFAAPATGVRPRCQADSIAFTDWYMDSHSCTRDGTTGQDCKPGFRFDGKLVMTDRFRPAMIPYQALLPRELDNLIVPVCLSTTHIAWGSVRLEPCWIHLGEVAGYAAALAQRQRTTVAALPVSSLQHALLESGASIAFLNDAERLLDDPRRSAWELQAAAGELDSFVAPC